MASPLRFAARKIWGRAFQRPPQQYYTLAAEVAVRENQRRLFPSISQGGSSLRRFSSSESPNLVNKNNHVPNNTEPTSTEFLWSPRTDKFVCHAFGYAFLVIATCYATIYVKTLRRGGPVVRKEPDEFRKS